MHLLHGISMVTTHTLDTQQKVVSTQNNYCEEQELIHLIQQYSIKNKHKRKNSFFIYMICYFKPITFFFYSQLFPSPIHEFSLIFYVVPVIAYTTVEFPWQPVIVWICSGKKFVRRRTALFKQAFASQLEKILKLRNSYFFIYT